MRRTSSDWPKSGSLPAILPGALELLHRLVVAVGNPLENLEPAAATAGKDRTQRGSR